MLHKIGFIKVADLYIAEKFLRFLFKHTLLRGYAVLYGEEQYRNEFAIKLCRIARLRELTLLYAAASFARSVSFRLFLQAKKSTDSMPGGFNGFP